MSKDIKILFSLKNNRMITYHWKFCSRPQQVFNIFALSFFHLNLTRQLIHRPSIIAMDTAFNAQRFLHDELQAMIGNGF